MSPKNVKMTVKFKSGLTENITKNKNILKIALSGCGGGAGNFIIKCGIRNFAWHLISRIKSNTFLLKHGTVFVK